MEETNKWLKGALKNTYKKLNKISNPPPKKASNTTKTPKKVDKTVKFQTNQIRIAKTLNKTSKSKTVKNNNKKNTSILYSKSDQNTDIDENDSDWMGWNNFTQHGNGIR